MSLRIIYVAPLGVGAALGLSLSAAVSAPTIGLDIAIDGVAGLAPAEVRSTSLQGQALAYAEWSGAMEKEDEPPAWRFYVSALGLAGKGPTEKFVGDFNALSNLEADKGARLYSVWGEWNRGVANLRAGALLADEEFATTESGGALFNSGFGWPGFVSGNVVNTGPAYFIPALGARVRYALAENVSLQAGIYDGDSFDSETGDSRVNRYGWRYSLSRRQSAMSLAELSYQPGKGPWTLKAGLWHHRADFTDWVQDDAGALAASSGEPYRIHKGNTGGYGVLLGQWESPLGWAGTWDTHLRAGWAQKDRNTVSCAWDAGWAWTGFLAGREDDTLVVGYLRTELSDDWVLGQRQSDPLGSRFDWEEVWEVGYHWQINETYSLHPDFQWIRHPGATPDRSAVRVFTLRFTASY